MTDFVPKPKDAYRQDWKAYDAAQTHELNSFMKLLADLCTNVEQPAYEFGRPQLPYSDMIFASALKIYSTFSLRRFMSQMEKAVAEGYMDDFCSYSTVSNYMRKKELTHILYKLIEISSLPLVSVETTFGVDASGFSTSRFGRYYVFKHSKDKQYKAWIKAHICCGLKTNVIASVQLTEENVNDHGQFISLLQKTSERFNVKEAVADKAYLSRVNLQFVQDLGATPFIPFKSNSNSLGRGCPIWNKMYHYFNANREDFMKHYHQRSNVETAFHMMKSKFRDSVRSKEITAQFNEVLLKILCHNICVVIQEVHELGISAEFNRTSGNMNA